MPHRLFALESYDRSGTGAFPGPVAPLTASDTRLVAVVHLPADDVVLALVEGPDAETVTAAATAAGWRVDRIGPAAWIHPREHHRAEPGPATSDPRSYPKYPQA